MSKTLSSSREKGARRPIDWSEVHRRMATSQAGLGARTAEEERKILRARARLLARPPEISADARESLEVVEFTLANERYGIEASAVREVYPLLELTPIPCTPSFVAGVLNVRGRIVSVIDMKKLLGLPEKGLTELNKVIVVQSGDQEMGILADAILGLDFVPRQQLQPSLPTLTGIKAEFLNGVTSDRLVVLNAERILSGAGAAIAGDLAAT